MNADAAERLKELNALISDKSKLLQVKAACLLVTYEGWDNEHGGMLLVELKKCALL